LLTTGDGSNENFLRLSFDDFKKSKLLA